MGRQFLTAPQRENYWITQGARYTSGQSKLIRLSCLGNNNCAVYCGVLTDEVTKTVGSQVT